LTFFDSIRNRAIPVALYYDVVPEHHYNKQKLIIFNTGYGAVCTAYDGIAHRLAEKGYAVLVIQHDLPADKPMPKQGDIYTVRKPYWDAGVQNILYVAKKFKKHSVEVNYDDVILMGHSNGGDIAMLMARDHPEFAETIITLDNRRVAIPLTGKAKIFSIRSNDQPADRGVLPSAQDQVKYGITINKVNIKHDDMSDAGGRFKSKKLADLIIDYLKNNGVVSR
jgi:dienelactone hydrolase